MPNDFKPVFLMGHMGNEERTCEVFRLLLRDFLFRRYGFGEGGKLFDRILVEMDDVGNAYLAIASDFEESTTEALSHFFQFYYSSTVFSSIQTSRIENEVPSAPKTESPRLGERLLLLILSKEDRVNIPGDLEEEFAEIATKHGARYAKLWYYKQVAGSAWPMIRKAVGWGLLASIGEWIRRII
jgi:hypothetical protein